jgi:hypothetical protein
MGDFGQRQGPTEVACNAVSRPMLGSDLVPGHRHQLIDRVEASVFVSPGTAAYLSIVLAGHNGEFVKNAELGVLGMNANVETFSNDSLHPSHAHSSTLLDRDIAFETAVQLDHECTRRPPSRMR